MPSRDRFGPTTAKRVLSQWWGNTSHCTYSTTGAPLSECAEESIGLYSTVFENHVAAMLESRGVDTVNLVGPLSQVAATSADTIVFQKFAAQNRPLHLDTLGQKRVGVAERRNGFEPATLVRSQEL